MSYLARTKKIDLITLADELEIEIAGSPKCAKLVELITGPDTYDEDFTKNLLARITAEREELEARERENALKSEERAFELQKLELQNKGQILGNPKLSLNKIMNKFENSDDIGVYLNLFERQVNRLSIDKDEWVNHLLGLLPLDIVQFVSREPDSVASNYDHIKKLLLKRFKLSTEQFRQKLMTHKKDIKSTWRDYAFEMNTFMQEWISGMGIETLEDLKELIVVDQIKRKIPYEVREHFCDELPKIKKVEDLINKLDEYEDARNDLKKSEYKHVRDFRKQTTRIEEPNKRNYRNDTNRMPNEKIDNFKRNNFDKKVIKCFRCGEPHKFINCPLRSTASPQNNSKKVNAAVSENYNSPDKILKDIMIGGKKFSCLVDTGSDINMASYDTYIALGRPKMQRNDLTLSGITGSKIMPIGYINVNTEMDNFVVNMELYIVRGLNYEIILGNNFLKNVNFRIDEKGLEITGKREMKDVKVNYVTVEKKISAVEKSKQMSERVIKTKSESHGSLRFANDTFPMNKKSDETANPINRERVSQNCYLETVGMPIKEQNDCLGCGESSKIEKSETVKTAHILLAETADAINIHELEINHIQNNDVKKELVKMLDNYKPNKIKDTNLKVNLILKDEIPIRQRPRKLAYVEQEFVEKQIEEWLAAGIIRESNSDYASPIVLARKKDNTYRLCIDYRSLNKKIIKDNFPLPLIEEMLDNIEHAQIYTTLDLRNGFFHIEMAEDSKKYTAFVTHNNFFEFHKLPFGLCVGSQAFQRYIQAVFRQLIKEKVILIYIDDIIILAQTEEEALMKLKRVLEVAAEYGLEFNFGKCQFLKKKIEFLGYIIENGTTRPSEAKTLAIKNFPEPKNLKNVHSFLGLTSYFRKFIQNYAAIAKPLSDLLRSDNNFKFGYAEKEAFETLKKELMNPPVLHIFKRGARTELHTDASSLGFGSVLLQEDDYGKLHPIHYMSRKTTPTQSKYSSYELETLAIIESLKKFRNYLLGIKFKIITDCAAFQKTLDKKDLSPKVARWALFLQEFDYEVNHRSGSKMKHVDALSRNTVLITNSSYDELTAKIKIAQETDEHTQTILKLIDKQENSEYFVKNGILYKYENDRELLVIPTNMQTELIREIHNQGHYAVEKTEIIVKENYYIPNLRKQIENVIINCIQCILCNRKRGKGEGFLNPIAKQNTPLETYHVDHIGPMPSTNKQYNHIFTVVDAFTKFVWLYPVRSTSTKEVLDKLKLQHNIFGNPKRLISDKGTAFTSHEFAEYCKEENIEHLTTTTGIPRGNGQVERIHRTLIPILSKLSIDDPTKWYKFVGSVQRIMNGTISRSTKFTPFQLLTGVKLRHKDDEKIKQLLEEEHLNTTMQERDLIRDIAKENILRIQEENKKAYNKKRKKASIYKVNDLVAIKKTQVGPGAKLKIKYFGPYCVTRVKKYDRYDVKKIGTHEGPALTSSAADHMKAWSVDS